MTSPIVTASNIIRNRLDTVIRPLLVPFGLPVLLENMPPDSAIDTSLGFIVMSITWGTGGQVSIGADGSNISRLFGVIEFHIFTPADIGTRKNEEIADILIDNMSRKQYGDVIADDYTISSEKVEDGNGNGTFWRSSVMIDFFIDEFI